MNDCPRLENNYKKSCENPDEYSKFLLESLLQITYLGICFF